MSQYWSPLAASLHPYVPGEQPKDKKYIKLNTNECPYPPSKEVIAAIQAAVNEDLRLYPDPNCDSLRDTIARRHGVQASQVFVGNGSDEILGFAFAAFFDPASTIHFADITYSFYQVYAGLYGLPYETIPLDEEFLLPVAQFMRPSGGVIIANPNAPTSLLTPLEEIEQLLMYHKDNVVIVDEAYIDFGGQSAVSLIHKYPNLLVVQTLSKSRALAGLRVGYAFGSEALIEGLNRVKNSFNSYTLDRLALSGAEAALLDEADFQDKVSKIVSVRESTLEGLAQLGFRSLKSAANFIFTTHPDYKAETLFRQLRDKGVLVRYFNKPRIDQYLRISVGSGDEMNELLAALQEIME